MYPCACRLGIALARLPVALSVFVCRVTRFGPALAKRNTFLLPPRVGPLGLVGSDLLYRPRTAALPASESWHPGFVTGVAGGLMGMWWSRDANRVLLLVVCHTTCDPVH